MTSKNQKNKTLARNRSPDGGSQAILGTYGSKGKKELRYIPVVPGTANYINQRRSPKPALAQEKKGKEENKKD